MNSGRVLVDTNVWVHFLRGSLPELGELLRDDRVSIHSCVIGELLVGNLARREMMLEFLLELPRVPEAEPAEAWTMIERRRLWGRGLQWNDVLLLAAARLGGVKLWTGDKRMAQVAEELDVGWRA